MATASSFTTVAKEDLTCPVCFELLRDPYTPKLLDCPHVCCALCIRKLIEGGKAHIECPECRQLTLIPDGGVEDMRTVIRVRSLAEKHQELMVKHSIQNVLHEHERTSEHVVPTRCAEHPSNTILFYCKRCNTTGCSLCMKKNHKGSKHDVVKTETAREEQKRQMQSVFTCVLEKLGELQMSVQRLEYAQVQIERTLDIHRKEIDRRAEGAILQVKEVRKFLADQLQKRVQSRLDAIMQGEDQMHMQIKEALTTVGSVKSYIDKTDQNELVIKHSDLEQTVKRSLGTNVKGVHYGNPIQGMSKYAGYKRPIGMTGVLGGIFPVNKLQFHLFDELDSFKLASDIVRSKDSLLVTDFNKKKTYIVVQNWAREYFRESHLPTSSVIYGVAVTSEGKYLVARETHVDVYSSSRKHEGQFNFRNEGSKTESNRYAFRITVMDDDSVVIGDERNSTIIVVSKEGVVLRVFPISVSPMRLCRMSNGMVAVSNWKAGKVCVVDVESGAEIGTINIPQALGLCYHTQTDCFLVGRRMSELPGSGFIDQFCALTGRHIGRIVDDLHAPYGMAITGLRDDFLAVADVKSVKVYRIIM